MEAPERLGRYRLIARLGQGGMATVYLAEDSDLGRSVALKLMHPFLASSKEASGRFQREARAVAALRHPNVLAVHDYAPEDGDRPAYLVTELIQGPTLKQFVEVHGAPLPEVAALIGVKLARALAAAHEHSIVHRDVKPENVMVDRGGRIVLCDFGIARLTSVESTMTATGAVIGSPAYMSPEQAAGDELDARSDLFSLGTVLYLLSTGVLPFQAKEPIVLLAKIHRGEHLPPTAKNPRVPPYLERAIERCLRVSREQRFQSAGEVAEALEAGLRADGFGDVDREIAAYFEDPPAFNATAEGRILATSIVQARAAAEAGESARALALCSRVFAWRPDDEAARALMAKLDRGSKLRKWAAIGAGVAGLIGVAAAGLTLIGRQTTEPNAPTGTKTETKTETATGVSLPLPLAGEGRGEGTSSPRPAPPVAVTTPAARVAVAARLSRPPPAVAPAIIPPSPPPVAPTPASAPPAPVNGELLLHAQPYCMDGRVDGKLPIDKGRTVTLAPGLHKVRCTGPGGKVIEREVTIVAGARAEVKLDFIGETEVQIQLTRGDEIQVGDGPRLKSGTRIHLAPGIGREVRLFKAGQQIARALPDILAGSCILRDDPLECRKP
ncbi:MAG: serine/threonine protein kinase [Myxococcales bacterium]|nr:serine/threonine protein kinase [Myxococcales bacterium]